MSAHALLVEEASAGQRIDLFVGQSLKLSRAKLKTLFESGAVRVDGRKVKKGQLISAGQRVEVELEETSSAAVPSDGASLRLLFEDELLVVVDKVSGQPAHPLKPGETGTVANALVDRFPECATASEDPREGGLCHRLDVETSGVMLAARTREAWSVMRDAFTQRRVEKHYWAVVTGPLADEGEIDLPLRHDPRKAERMLPALQVSEGSELAETDARPALSSFKVLARHGEYSWVSVHIETGVHHQIRAHLAAVGAPILADTVYEGREHPGLTRFFLHARSLGFVHPVKKTRVVVESPLPSELSAILEALNLRLPGT